MKKILSSLIVILYYSFFSVSAQTTYYWIGAPGSAGTPTDWASGWNTAADGSGNPRTASAGTDILVFDGNTLATKTLWVGNIPKDSAAQIQLINGVTVTITTTNGSMTDAAESVSFGSTYGGAIIPVQSTGIATKFRLGDFVSSGAGVPPAQVLGFNGADEMYISNEGGTTASVNIFRVPTIYIKGNPGLTIDATSVLNVGASSTTTLQPFAIVLATGAKGEVAGRISFQSRGLAARVSAVTPLNLVFKDGGRATSGAGSSTGSQRGYHFGNPFVTGSVANADLRFINDGGRVLFERGSTFQHNGQQNSPFGTAINAVSPLTFVQAITFQTGSNYLQTYANGYVPYFYSNGATFANLTWNSTGFPGSNTTTFYLNPVRIDTFNVMQMSSPSNSSTSSRVPIYGDYINNSTSTVTINSMYFAGNGVAQRISGSNTTSPIANLFVLDSALVVLEKNVSVTNSVNVLGDLNVGSYTITGSGTSNLNNYSSYSRLLNSPTGSDDPIGGAAITAGSTTVHLRNMNNVNSNILGSNITSPSHPAAIQPGTFITAYLGSGNWAISKPATLSADSTSSPTLALSIYNQPGTIITSNAGGVGSSFPSFSSFTLGEKANYTFNTPTTTPFPGAVASPVSVGDLTLNANVTLNKALTVVRGTIGLNSNILTVNATDTIRITGTNPVTGTLGASAHINTVADASTGNSGYVIIDTITTTRVFPVGNNGSYLPVTITPATSSTFAVSVKQGATANGKPNGTPLTASEKANVVDANYIVNRLTGSGDAMLRLAFPASLKGSGFTSIQNEQLGIARYNETSSNWEAPKGGGDNSMNFAQATFDNFSPFRVEVNPNGVLPVRLSDITATKENGKVVISWKVLSELNVDNYVVERLVGGTTFAPINAVKARGAGSYTLTDVSPLPGKNHYRLKIIDRDNAYSFSKVVLVNFGSVLTTLSVSPNPVVHDFFTISFKNMKAGKVSVKMFNNIGQMVVAQQIDYNGSSDNQLINLPSKLSKGLYQLVIADGQNVQKASVVIE